MESNWNLKPHPDRALVTEPSRDPEICRLESILKQGTSDFYSSRQTEKEGSCAITMQLDG